MTPTNEDGGVPFRIDENDSPAEAARKLIAISRDMPPEVQKSAYLREWWHEGLQFAAWRLIGPLLAERDELARVVAREAAGK